MIFHMIILIYLYHSQGIYSNLPELGIQASSSPNSHQVMNIFLHLFAPVEKELFLRVITSTFSLSRLLSCWQPFYLIPLSTTSTINYIEGDEFLHVGPAQPSTAPVSICDFVYLKNYISRSEIVSPNKNVSYLFDVGYDAAANTSYMF